MTSPPNSIHTYAWLETIRSIEDSVWNSIYKDVVRRSAYSTVLRLVFDPVRSTTDTLPTNYECP